MQRNSVLPVAIALSLIASGCLFQSKHNGPQNEGQAQGGPAWTLQLQSNCSDYYDEYCVAKHGFSVTADGKYLIGPAPAGQKIEGKLTLDELQKINTLLSEALADMNAEGAENCELDHQGVFTARENKLIFEKNWGKSVLIRSDLERYCFKTANADKAIQLHEEMKKLAEKYYALPFPDACAEASAAVEALYGSVKACNSDIDCAYVNTEYEIVPGSASQFIIVDNCTTIRPMVAANTEALKSNQPLLRKALENAQKVCGNRIGRPDCLGYQGFESSGGAPVCVNNYCRPNPNVVVMH